MDEQPPFTIEQFYKYITQRRLMGGKCRKCGKVHLPPRPLCDRCFSNEFEWTQMPKKGRLVAYTVIHMAPPQFQKMLPYTVGIIQLENGLRMPGIIKEATLEQLKVGMEMVINFGKSAVQQQWPQWPRYYFKPVKQ